MMSHNHVLKPCPTTISHTTTHSNPQTTMVSHITHPQTLPTLVSYTTTQIRSHNHTLRPHSNFKSRNNHHKIMQPHRQIPHKHDKPHNHICSCITTRKITYKHTYESQLENFTYWVTISYDITTQMRSPNHTHTHTKSINHTLKFYQNL